MLVKQMRYSHDSAPLFLLRPKVIGGTSKIFLDLVSGIGLGSVPLLERLSEVLDQTLLVALSGSDDFARTGEGLGEGDNVIEAETLAKLEDCVDSVEFSIVNLLSVAHQKLEAFGEGRVRKRDRSDIAIRAVDAERAVRAMGKLSVKHAEVC